MDFEPITFTRAGDDGERTLIAYTPAQAVKLRFEGWAEQKDPDAGPPPQIAADGTVITSDADSEDADTGTPGDADSGGTPAKTRRSRSSSK